MEIFKDALQLIDDLGLTNVLIFSAGLSIATTVINIISKVLLEDQPKPLMEHEWTGFVHVPRRRKKLSRRQRWMMMHRSR